MLTVPLQVSKAFPNDPRGSLRCVHSYRNSSIFHFDISFIPKSSCVLDSCCHSSLKRKKKVSWCIIDFRINGKSEFWYDFCDGVRKIKMAACHRKLRKVKVRWNPERKVCQNLSEQSKLTWFHALSWHNPLSLSFPMRLQQPNPHIKHFYKQWKKHKVKKNKANQNWLLLILW